jgi:hypothetical protein
MIFVLIYAFVATILAALITIDIIEQESITIGEFMWATFFILCPFINVVILILWVYMIAQDKKFFNKVLWRKKKNVS